MSGDFFYSKSAGLYVSRKPLAIDARVKKAAKDANVALEWDDEGTVNNIDFDAARRLMQSLGSKILTPVEYWGVYADAVEAKDADMLRELQSDRYTEWLNRVYISSDGFIESPEIAGGYSYRGEVQRAQCPHGRPGWFNPEGNIGHTGEPLRVEQTRTKFGTSWKYWSHDLRATGSVACAPVRGYVTSVGRPSYDLGIPVNSRQPKLMVRECRHEPLTAAIDAPIIRQAESAEGRELVDFIEEYGGLFSASSDSLVYKMREGLFDRLGEIALDLDISRAADQICKVENKRLSFEKFAGFVRSSRKSLEDALSEGRDVVFVMGHKNPDTDTAISCLFEAYRNHLIDQAAVYVPVIQSERIPDEVTHLLGDLSSTVLLSNDQLYERAKGTGLARWISVDQNREPEVQKYFISIIDHHAVSETARNRDLPKMLEMLGSTAALVTRKYLGMGLELDREMARILYGATLMDTENRVEHKMTPKDVRLMDYLKEKAGVHDDDGFYGELMSYLLNTDDAGILFGRDYKEDWGFGFAVAKIKNGFSEKGDLVKGDLVSRLQNMAAQNNKDKNLPLTLLKITDYGGDNETVNRERLYLVFNRDATLRFRRTVRDTLESIIKFEFPGENVEAGDEQIDFWGSGLQLSRKKIALILEPIVAAFNRYFFSPSIGKWVKRDFQKKTGNIKGEYSTDEKGRINNITYEEAKELARRQGFSLLSLSEYWRVLSDAKRISDVQMVESLQGSNFVEFLDTKILDTRFIADHEGERREVKVPEGNPGLIRPDDVDLETGLPTLVRPPNEYGNRALWRYWQPDADEVVLCRSYIFLLQQPCLDGKFHPGESFPNLGLRPVVEEVPEPEVKVNPNEEHLTVELLEEGDTKQWKWPRRIWDIAID